MNAEPQPAPVAAAPDAAAFATPAMAQYLASKRAHPDCLLFYRMGDFYELFFEDAVKAARALDIALTKRGQHGGQDIPMCGVPAHAMDGYLARLIRSGFKVAVCEQMEDPAEAKKRGAKAVVRREVIRVVTPGTITEDALLDARSHNYLAALAEAGKRALAGLIPQWQGRLVDPQPGNRSLPAPRCRHLRVGRVLAQRSHEQRRQSQQHPSDPTDQPICTLGRVGAPAHWPG